MGRLEPSTVPPDVVGHTLAMAQAVLVAAGWRPEVRRTVWTGAVPGAPGGGGEGAERVLALRPGANRTALLVVARFSTQPARPRDAEPAGDESG